LLAGQAGHPLTGYYEIADLVETSRNSGIWKATTVRTVTDAAMTTGGARQITSATANFTAADTGRMVALSGAGSGGSTYYGVIRAGGDATNAYISTLYPAASVAVTGATMRIVDAYTEDGVHPSYLGHAAMAAGVTVPTTA